MAGYIGIDTGVGVAQLNKSGAIVEGARRTSISETRFSFRRLSASVSEGLHVFHDVHSGSEI